MTEKNTRENYTRVTSILYPFSGLDKIDPQVINNAARRGTKVHKICEAIISGLGEIDVDDETRGYVESFKLWWNKGHDIVEMERRFWCDEHHITGQVDLIINTPEGLAIADLKTSSRPSKTWPAQGAAYAYLARKANLDIKKIYFIHLKKTGKEPKIYEYAVDDSFFLAILTTWKHFYMQENPQEKEKIPPQKEYGDDIKDFERKEKDMWTREYTNNPIYQGYK